jgi:phenylacetate-CoA ligase
LCGPPKQHQSAINPESNKSHAYGYGLFTGGLGLHYGGEELGVMVTPMSGGQTRKQIMLLQDFEPTAISCTPSYALNLAEEAEAMGVDIRKLPLRIGIHGAEPWTEEMRFELESRLGIDAIDIYGLSEVIGPGVGVECINAKDGLHIWEDHFLVECVDVDSGEPLPYGEEGEIVFTSLTKEAFPIIRYRTRDISSLNPAPCKCGRTHVRMKRITGRSDDMLIIRGVNVYPSQVESVLMKSEILSPFYQIEVFREGNLDTMLVNVEAGPPLAAQGGEAMSKVAAGAVKDIKDFIGVSCKVNVKSVGEIPRSQGKAVRVVDHRKAKT